MARDPQVSMRRRSGTLEIFFWGRPNDYEGVYQCTATNEFGSALSSHIHLRVSSKPLNTMQFFYIKQLVYRFLNVNALFRGPYVVEGVSGASISGGWTSSHPSLQSPSRPSKS